MATEVCLQPEFLKKKGYFSIKDWIETPGNVYTGVATGRFCQDPDDIAVLKWYDIQASKWKNPIAPNPDVRSSMLLYVKHLFRSDLIYDIDELRGKNLGCFCHEPRKVWSEPKCHNQVLVDLLNKCYHHIEEMIRKKKAEHVDEKLPDSFITLTFGDAAENNYGMKQIGKKLGPGQGFNLNDLLAMQKSMKSICVDTKIIDLTKFLEQESIPVAEKAYVLVMKGAATRLLQRKIAPTVTQLDMFNEQTTRLKYDTRALMRGRVVNKHARWNLCFDDESSDANYEEGKGTIVAYKKVPLMQAVRDQFEEFFGPKAADLKVEANYYYDTTKCGIGWHGDSERVKVIAMRLGYVSMPIHFQWFYKRKPIGKRITIPLEPGDMYVMSEKAVGTDWKRQVIPTLRHATGCHKFLEMK